MKIRYIWAAALIAIGACCSTAYSQEKQLVGINGAVYSLTPEEAEAVSFLYKSMPLSDKLMYPAEYFIKGVRTTLKAREEMPWGKDVPDDIWRHFVLPLRSNNEYLDNFRTLYYPELKRRIEGMSMKDAALEINHWLHEKVTYQPSDSRTSAPMATIKTSKGRCGEESVLGVAAFRTVGIPARQVYTPRWAHTDDNHAWVEVWVDGKWHFLGACEPEPELDRAWFNAPASRGMLMHTRVFGDYPGPEQIISVNKGITEINVTDNYVPVRESVVEVTDASGRPVPGIEVKYMIYNYAEFYPAVSMKADSKGRVMLKTGQGDMLAWAANGDNFGFAKVSGPLTKLRLDHKIGQAFETDIDIVPPVENPIPSHVTEAEIAENQRRFEAENKLRSDYEKTLWGERYCRRNLENLRAVMPDDLLAETDLYLEKAKGNWEAVYQFLTAVPEERLEEAVLMLSTISEKDLRDTPANVLINTLANTEADLENPLYVEYLLNPRISNELLSDYRKTLRMPEYQDKLMTVNDILDYIAENVTIDNAANAYRVPITPTEVWKGRMADSHSRDIFFVALCRNNKIPARIDPVTGAVQYHDGNNWLTVNFESDKQASAKTKPEGIVKGSYESAGYLANPEYYRHFSICSMDSGIPRQLEFGADMGENFETILKNGSRLPEGYYLMVTGVREASGAVSAHLNFFNIKADAETVLPLVMRHRQGAVEVIGSIDPEALYLPKDARSMQSLLSTTGRGYFVIAMMGDTDEPSNHAAQELGALTNTLNQWGRPLVVIGRERPELAGITDLHYGSDPDGNIRQTLLSAVDKGVKYTDNIRLPLILVADSFGRVVFISKGYDTSLTQKLQQLIPQL